MLDINLLRKDIGAAADRLRTRGFDFDVDEFNVLEAERKTVQISTEELQARRNALSKQIGVLKSKGEDASRCTGRSRGDSRAGEGSRNPAGRHPGAAARHAAQRSESAARIGSGRQIRRRQPGGATLGNAARLRLRATRPCRRRCGARARLRGSGQAVGIALCGAARPRCPPASCTGAVHARYANRRAWLHRVLHAVHRQPRNVARDRPVAEVPRRHVLGHQGRRRRRRKSST